MHLKSISAVSVAETFSKSILNLSLQAAERLKRTIAEETGIPLVPPLPQQQQQRQRQQHDYMQHPPEEEAETAAALDVAAAKHVDLHPYNVRRSALALQRYADQMPEVKRRCFPDLTTLSSLHPHPGNI